VGRELRDDPVTAPVRRPRRRPGLEFLRWAWGQLTSMRTALLLLFLLALAAIPGSMIPQEGTSAISVIDFKEKYPGWDAVLEPLGMYHVYTSPGFSAIYLLLFISLVGCIIPRVIKYARSVRKPPPALPARIDRLPETRSAAYSGPTDEALDRAERYLRGRRYRVARAEAGLSAERGYLREAGNLVFHVSLLAVLFGLAWSNLWGYHGTAVVVEGRGFANVLTQYDDFTSGAAVDTDSLEAFSLQVNSFVAEFETGDVQTGAARKFEASLTVTDADGTRDETLTVNEPIMTAGGTQVNLLGHGYAASFTVRDGDGNVAFSGPVVFLPQDGNYTSYGVIKVPDARPSRLAFEAYFFPTAAIDEVGGPYSSFPDALNPQVWLNAWYGEPKEETGAPESVYALDTTGLEPVLADDEEPLRAQMAVGAGFTLPDDLGSITFDGWERWVKLQVSDTPGNAMTLASILIGLIGLSLSLSIRPRRLFIRVAEGMVLTGGLDRADAASGLEDEVAALLAAAADSAPTGHNGDAPEPETHEEPPA